MKDHQIAALVNELRDIAIEFHSTQQLRERISQAVTAALAQQDVQAVPSDLVDKLRRFRGLSPHNNSSNVCQGDGYFYASIEAQYTSDQIAAANDTLNAAMQEKQS